MAWSACLLIFLAEHERKPSPASDSLPTKNNNLVNKNFLLRQKLRIHQRTAMFQMFYLILLITFHGSFQSSVNAQDTSLDVCSSEFHDMRTTNPQLANASVAVFQAYNQTCWNENKCSSSYEDPVSVTTRDFSGLTGPSYKEMKSTCESIGTDYTLCAVTTEQRQGGFTFRDLGKPLCLPPSCSVDDVVVADTYVKDCMDASNCEILETSLDCGSRNINPSGDCMTDVQNVHDNVEMTDFSDRIYQYVLKQCLSVVLGGSSSYCYVSASTTISVNMDMSGFHTDESFIAFEKVCHEKNGVVCQISYNEKARNEQSFLSLTFENEYEEYPICVPTSCTDEDPQDIGLLLYYRNNPPEGQRRLLAQECDPETGLCTLEVDSFQCRSAAPTCK